MLIKCEAKRIKSFSPLMQCWILNKYTPRLLNKLKGNANNYPKRCGKFLRIVSAIWSAPLIVGFIIFDFKKEF